MYTRERIAEVINHCLKYYTFEKKEDNTKEDFLQSVMMELDNNFEIEEANEVDKNIKLNRELYLQNQKANPDDTI